MLWRNACIAGVGPKTAYITPAAHRRTASSSASNARLREKSLNGEDFFWPQTRRSSSLSSLASGSADRRRRRKFAFRGSLKTRLRRRV